LGYERGDSNAVISGNVNRAVGERPSPPPFTSAWYPWVIEEEEVDPEREVTSINFSKNEFRSIPPFFSLPNMFEVE